MKTSLYEILEQSSRSALPLQLSSGAMPPGHNGPYHDPETSVRNTAHWLITFLKMFNITGDNHFRMAAERALNYLLSPETRPMHATFWCRKNPEKDYSNGLIGQAWAIEALIIAAKEFMREDILEIATDIFSLHPYNEKIGRWRIVNVDGSYGPFDPTSNHQIWFAAAGALISQMDRYTINNNVTNFLDHLQTHITLYSTGLLRHESFSFYGTNFSDKLKHIQGIIRNKPSRTHMKIKSYGYHGFNLYGMALLHSVNPAHIFWSSPKLSKLLDFVETVQFENGLISNKYGYPYNPPGFEIPYALHIFGRSSKNTISYWVQNQLKFAYDFENHQMCLNAEDPTTLASRIYEATRLPDVEILL